ncbi:UDP-N-acetylmuramoyl-tripeptide--D-alanyl-D-alanine ligase [Paenibacillus sp. L3-i20]|uniref:UDP-N-acetylmuramoyl-tripeptide--D-alanyl-D- alanine ligase n=1 Tax=Paenibacillus sp. L3-i20 TaxID=2905833 RepID=UPI001EDF97B4|nr:UDP-N-acetylmuramoyl-tripeptide--D-alanyl-D-alanine ligase [Paenibacillus sp. L3-i20]GKU78363.1 UDP-N-acetylmuramoyl-tripeptide--D-alanyl-D-alanine ligase [Paenibacillus sp. L3-i20]
MIKRSVSQIAAMCGAKLKGGHPEQILCGVTTDSRSSGGGDLFVPLVGERFDGHDFAEQAAASGAKAMLWQKDKEIPSTLTDVSFLLVRDTLVALQRLASTYRSELMVRVVGITGSNGKTTTKDMAAALLSTQYRVLKTEGNLNNHIGLPLTLLKMDEETEVAVIEMGMSGFGEIEELTKIAQPDAAIITNVGDAHLLQLGSRAGIAKAKLEIVSGLGENGILLYNGDEPLLAEGLQSLEIPDTTTLRTFGLQLENEWSANNISLEPFGSKFIALYKEVPSGLGEVHIPTPGRHNISNALAAIAVARYFGVGPSNIARGFSELKLTGMRIEPSRAFNQAIILNDAYNANPTATRAAIDLVAGLEGFGRRWIVLGDMLELGPEEEQLHRGIGEYITKDKAEAVLTFGPLSHHTADGARLSFGKAGHEELIRHFDDKDSLAEWLKERLQPEDIVLVKGSRGMRMEQVVQALEKG